jgi:uroporphyrinogen decarboxylase
MNTKYRFLNTLRFNNVDRIPFIETGVWPQTIERWIKEGMPSHAIDDDTFFWGNDFFGLEGFNALEIETQLPYPFIEPFTIEENSRYIIYIDKFYRKRKALKTGAISGTRLCMDQYIEHPVKDRKSFLSHIKRYSGNYDKRYPSDYNWFKKNYKKFDKPFYLLPQTREHFGYYSMLRTWIGTENLSYMFYDNPNLIKEACQFLTDFIKKTLMKALEDMNFDLYLIHEDMGFKTAPLVSPELFKKFFFSEYKNLIDFVKTKGVTFVMVDTDGNFESLIPLFLDAGVDCFEPLEIAANMDPVRLRKKYGKSFSMIGGFDKRILTKDKKDIEKELRRLEPLINDGGFMPTVDHGVPHDVSFNNYKYYLKIKKKIIG